MKKILILAGVAIIFIASWQCDAAPKRDQRRNDADMVKVVVRVNKDGKIIVANVPAWKIRNKQREQLVVSTDEDGTPVVNIDGEIRELHRNKTFRGTLKKL